MAEKLQYGELWIGGGTAFASGADPTAEVIDGTGVAAGRSNGAVLSATAGTITIERSGVYDVGFMLQDIAPASASGVMTVELQKDSAAFTQRVRAKTIAPAAAANSVCMFASQRVHLERGAVLRAVITGTVGGIITIADGVIYAHQVPDAS